MWVWMMGERELEVIVLLFSSKPDEIRLSICSLDPRFPRVY